MRKIIEKIYELKFSDLTTPWNLMENAFLDNYEYVKYYTKNSGLTVEMKCQTLSTFNIFYYHFDKENKLDEIYLEKSNGEKELKFSRKMELEKILAEYLNSSNLEKIS